MDKEMKRMIIVLGTVLLILIGVIIVMYGLCQLQTEEYADLETGKVTTEFLNWGEFEVIRNIGCTLMFIGLCGNGIVLFYSRLLKRQKK